MGIFDKIVEGVDRQTWVNPLSDLTEKAVKDAFKAGGRPGQTLKNFLHGTWLGHPLHTVLVPVPIGAWSVALAFDAIDGFRGTKGLQPGADGAVAVGLIGAGGAALAGLADWHHFYPASPRRIGLIHGLLNLTSTTLYAASLILRLVGLRGPGRWVSFAGYGVLVVGSYLGGHLTHALRMGVNQAIEVPELQPDHSDYVAVLAEDKLVEGKLTKVEMKGFPLLLVRQGARIHALAELCSHLGCSLVEEGKLEGDSVKCTCHGSVFLLEDGRVLNGPATSPQPRFEVRVRSGKIEVRAAAKAWSAIIPSKQPSRVKRRSKAV